MAKTMAARNVHERALGILRDLASEAETGEMFARRGVELLPKLVASDMTTLSVCDMTQGKRSVISAPGQSISAPDRARFDRYFSVHPLVRFYSEHLGGHSHRISDSIPWRQFRNAELYHEYCRRIGIDHAVAMPLYADRRLLVSFVLNRSRKDFTEREMAVLELVRPVVARLYRQFLAIDRLNAWMASLARAGMPEAPQLLPDAAGGGAAHRAGLDTPALTQREREVLSWVGAGKADRQIADILGISWRTVQKHLEHAYARLGVESRTAAVMRAAPWLGSYSRR